MGEYVSVSKEELQELLQRVKVVLQDHLISEQTKKELYDAVKIALSADADFREVIKRTEAAEAERRETVNTILSADPEFMGMLEELKPEPEAPTELLEVIAGAMGNESDEKGIQAARDEYNEHGLNLFSSHDSKTAYVSTSIALRAAYNQQRYKDGLQWVNPETGEIATFRLLSDFMTPAEIDFVEAVVKYMDAGQVTKDGKVWATDGQLGRAMGMQNGSGSLSEKQQNEIYETIEAISSDARRVSADFNRVFQVYGGFEATGFDKYRIMDYYRWKGKKVRGKPIEHLYVFTFSEVMKCAAGIMAENIRFGTDIKQEIKNVQSLRYAVELAEPTEKGTKDTHVRTFATAEERSAYYRRNGITPSQIVREYTTQKTVSVSKQFRSIRAVILNFAFSYVRARNAKNPSNFDPRLPYAKIWEACAADGCTAYNSPQQKKQNIKLVHAVFEWLKYYGVCNWTTYKNSGSKTPDGVRISVIRELEGDA